MSTCGINFETMLNNYKNYLIPAGIDLSDPITREVVERTNSSAKALRKEMVRTFKDGDFASIPWKGIITTEASRERVSAIYTNIAQLARAYLYPGLHHNDAELLKDIIALMKWTLNNLYRGGLPADNAGINAIDDPQAHTFGVFQSLNWWHFDIGIPMTVLDILVMLKDTAFPNELTSAYLTRVHKYSTDPDFRACGSDNNNAGAGNKADKCRIILLHGLLARDEERVKTAASLIFTAKTIPERDDTSVGDGYYSDGSFIEHSFFPYALGYGTVALASMGIISSVTRGETVPFNEEYRRKITGYIVKTYLPSVWMGVEMPNLAGRGISRRNVEFNPAALNRVYMLAHSIYNLIPIMNEQTAGIVKSALKSWITGNPDLLKTPNLAMNAELRKLADDDSINPCEPMGILARNHECRVFWRTEDFVFSISANGEKYGIAPYSTINSENLKGIHTGDGMTYLFLKNDYAQYTEDYFATVDYTHLSGTTLEQRPLSEYTDQREGTGELENEGRNKYINPKHTHTEAFVLSENGEHYCAAAFKMDLSGANHSMNMDLTANKSWFMLGNKVIMLGSNITSQNNRQVDTTVENRRIPAGAEPVLTRWGSFAHLSYNKANIGYYIPSNQDITAKVRPCTGSWHETNRIYSNERITNDYAQIIIHHSVNPASGTYEYAILPNTGLDEARAFAQNPDYVVIACTDTLHAVYDKRLNILAANNFGDAPVTVTSSLSGKGYVVDKYSCLMIKE